MDPALSEWIENNMNLIEWLRKVDKDMEYGDVIIHYHQGKVKGCDLCPKFRDEFEEK